MSGENSPAFGSSLVRVSLVRLVEATELIACHVLIDADAEGQRVSMELVRRCLQRLGSHPTRALCFVAAGKAAAAEVYGIASKWQRLTNATRARTLR